MKHWYKIKYKSKTTDTLTVVLHVNVIVHPKMNILSPLKGQPWCHSSLLLLLLRPTLQDIKCVYDGRASPPLLRCLWGLHSEGRIHVKVRFAPPDRSQVRAQSTHCFLYFLTPVSLSDSLSLPRGRDGIDRPCFTALQLNAWL